MKLTKTMFALTVCAALSFASGTLSAQEAGHEGHDHAGHLSLIHI